MFSKLKYLDSQLYFDNVNLNDISKKYKTPIYIYSKDKIIENYKQYDNNFKKYNFKDYQISYAVKANNNLTILKILKELGSGFDTVSGNEISKCLLTKVDSKKIVYSGVGKTQEELEFAINANIGQINVESYEEYLLIKKIVNKLKKSVNIAIRFNPNVDAHTNKKITTGKKENKFGIDLESIKKIIEDCKNNKLIKFKGLSVHIGSQILDFNAFEEIFKILKEIYKNYNFSSVDFGGGLGIQYRESENSPNYDGYFKLLNKYFKNFKGKIILEPGRSIIGDTGIFLTKITYIKKTKFNNFIVVDGGMNNLIRPAMYNAYHHPMVVNLENNKKIKYSIVGPICESSDVFNRDVKLNEITNIDNNYIVFLSAGAYGSSMSSNYNLHNIAGELLIENKKVTQIKKPINYKDLLKFEKI